MLWLFNGNVVCWVNLQWSIWLANGTWQEVQTRGGSSIDRGTIHHLRHGPSYEWGTCTWWTSTPSSIYIVWLSNGRGELRHNPVHHRWGQVAHGDAEQQGVVPHRVPQPGGLGHERVHIGICYFAEIIWGHVVHHVEGAFEIWKMELQYYDSFVILVLRLFFKIFGNVKLWES